MREDAGEEQQDSSNQLLDSWLLLSYSAQSSDTRPGFIKPPATGVPGSIKVASQIGHRSIATVATSSLEPWISP